MTDMLDGLMNGVMFWLMLCVSAGVGWLLCWLFSVSPLAKKSKTSLTDKELEVLGSWGRWLDKRADLDRAELERKQRPDWDKLEDQQRSRVVWLRMLAGKLDEHLADAHRCLAWNIKVAPSHTPRNPEHDGMIRGLKRAIRLVAEVANSLDQRMSQSEFERLATQCVSDWNEMLARADRETADLSPLERAKVKLRNLERMAAPLGVGLDEVIDLLETKEPPKVHIKVKGLKQVQRKLRETQQNIKRTLVHRTERPKAKGRRS